MNDKNKNNRRNFLKTAGAALVAASVPAAIMAQKTGDTPAAEVNNLRQIGLASHVYHDSALPGVFGQAVFQFQMAANLETGIGCGTLSDPVVSEINSHIQIQSAVRQRNDVYLFRGIVSRSQSSELMGKAVRIRVQVLQDDNCDVSLTIEDTTLAINLLLPAVMKVRERA